MTLKEMKLKTVEALKADLAHTREDLRDVRFSISQNQHKDVRDARELKKTIARLLTVIHEKETSSTNHSIKK